MCIPNIFFPEKHSFPDSRFNKNITVLKYLNSSTLLVDGLVESGDVMTQVWRKGITSLLPQSFKPEKVLLLGLAGGCNAHLINKYFPKAKITAVEIDPVMVDIGKKYFRLGKVKNINIVIADAQTFVNSLKNTDQFDLIMVDCFVGKKIPKKFETVEFFQKLKNHSRFVLINRIWWYKDKAITTKVFKNLSPHFFFIKAHTYSNVIISLV